MNEQVAGRARVVWGCKEFVDHCDKVTTLSVES